MDEWELMMVSQNIETGDTVDIEDEDGLVFPAVYIGYSTRYTIRFMEQSGKIHLFKALTLESTKGEKYIKGLSKCSLSLKTVMK
jgi:hypothetical protein